MHSEAAQIKTGRQKRVFQQAARQAEWRRFSGDGTFGALENWPPQWLLGSWVVQLLWMQGCWSSRFPWS